MEFHSGEFASYVEDESSSADHKRPAWIASLRRLDAPRVEKARLGHRPQEGTGLQQLGQDEHQVPVTRIVEYSLGNALRIAI